MNTTRELWHRADAIFRQAIQTPAAERDAYIRDSCLGDEALRRYVEELLAADAQSDERLRVAIGDSADELAAGAASGWNGRMLGAYRIEGRIAAGGMGVVFRARRSDAQFERRVAIKLLSSPLASEEARRRFRAERQILANLNHPNIAQLLDGGTTDEGVPYLVMDLIEGVAIDEYCDGARLTIEERLRLFLKVCAAVQYAHQHLIVHRDLKPSNILVTADGTPKLLDFGIAKLLGPEGGAVTLTAQDSRLLTPRHASPEQVRGASITTASDIYSLGVLLYELLCGCFPYRFTSTAPLELERAICNTEPLIPSSALRGSDESLRSPGASLETIAGHRRLSPQVLYRRLRGDLDNIVLLAMRKEPQERYATVRELADDIERHLDKQPITARAATWRYRTRKFLQRHAWGAVAAASVTVTIAALVGFYTWRLAAERDRLAQERATAEQVSRFLVGLFEEANPTRARPDVTAREVLEKSATEIERLRAEQPMVASRLMISMGRAYAGLAMYERARDLLSDALDIRHVALGPEHLDVAEAMHYLGVTQAELRDHKEALGTLGEALRIREAVLGPEALPVAETLFRIGFVQMRLGDYQAMGDALRRAVPIYERELGPDSPITAEVIGMFGTYHYLVAERERARELLLQALAIRERAFGAEDIRIVADVHNLGRFEWETGNYAAALNHYRRALALKEKYLGRMHPDLGPTLYGLANSSQNNGELDNSRNYYQRVVALQEQTLGPDDFYLAMSLSGQGFLLLELGDLRGARASLTRSLAIAEKKWGPMHPDLRAPLAGLAKVEIEEGRFAAASVLLERARVIMESQFDPEHLDVLRTKSSIATMNRRKGDYELARRQFEEVLAGFEHADAMQHPFVNEALFNMGEILKVGGDYAGAEKYYLAALENFNRSSVERRRAVADCLEGYADLLGRTGRSAEALTYHTRASAIYRFIGAERAAVSTAS
jgi:serine/threonine-protein kinase